jgi:tripartite-type tricarboxylate transporter receptor subunit TctC
MQASGRIEIVSKKFFGARAACVIALAWCASISLAAYPERPMRFIIPFPPGGGADSLARIVGAVAGESLGQQIVIDNRAGAGGNIAGEAAAKAAPDGYTLLQSNISHVISASLYRKLDYDIVRDFVPVTLLASIPFALAVHPSLNVSNIRELVALAKAKPGQLAYASSGNGGPSHLAMEMFKTINGVDIRHVPYKGAASISIDLVGGQVQMAFFTVAGLLPLNAGGRVKALALASPRRSALMPELPTFAEQGMPGFEATTWFGVSLPKGATNAMVRRLHTAFTQALKLADVRERLIGQGFDVIGSTPEEFEAYIRVEMQRWSKAVRESRASVD